jgi:hypothetical protein
MLLSETKKRCEFGGAARFDSDAALPHFRSTCLAAHSSSAKMHPSCLPCGEDQEEMGEEQMR